MRKLIKKEFGFWIGNVTSYKVLYLLEMDGYVESYKKGRRKYYRITKKGLEQLSEAKGFLKEVYESL